MSRPVPRALPAITGFIRSASLKHAFKYTMSFNEAAVNSESLFGSTRRISARSLSCLSGFLDKWYRQLTTAAEVYKNETRILAFLSRLSQQCSSQYQRRPAAYRTPSPQRCVYRFSATSPEYFGPRRPPYCRPSDPIAPPPDQRTS